MQHFDFARLKGTSAHTTPKLDLLALRVLGQPEVKPRLRDVDVEGLHTPVVLQPLMRAEVSAVQRILVSYQLCRTASVHQNGIAGVTAESSNAG